MQNIFYPDLNDFCRKYLILNRPEGPLSPLDVAMAPIRAKEQEARLFEQLLLFDRISFKVHGENIPLVLLFNTLGEKGLEELIEQDAIRFVLWTPMVLYMKDNIAGVEPLVYGGFNSPAHCDPEMSIELGLKWMANPLSATAKRRLVKKVRRLYEMPDNDLAGTAVQVTKSAFNHGKFLSRGLSPLLKSMDKLAEPEKKLLSDCATELLEYYYLLRQGMTSYSNFRYFDQFSMSVGNIGANHIPLRFNEFSKLEGFPNLQELYRHLDQGLHQVAKLRSKRSSVKFREWLASVKGGVDGSEITREYLDSLTDAKGLFDSAGGKFVKSVAVTALGAVIGASIGGVEGAEVGAVAGKVLEPAVHLGLDLIDSFLLERITKGWTPRMFFDDLRKLPRNKI